MKPEKILMTVFIILALASITWAGKGRSEESSKNQIMESYGKLPIYFIQNNGQVDESVKFYEKGGGHSIFFTEDGIYFSFFSKEQFQKEGTEKLKKQGKDQKIISDQVVIKPVDGKRAEIVAENMLSGKVNFFTGNDPNKWKTDIPTYGTVRYREIFPDIDLIFYGNQRQLEYDVVVKPGADPSSAAFKIEGARDLKTTKDGDLEIILNTGSSIIQKKPHIYQEIGGNKIEIKGEYAIKKEKEGYIYAFKVKEYDNAHVLVIDPVFVYSTYLGGGSSDFGYGIAVDSQGHAYVTGYAGSNDYPTQNPIQAGNAGIYDVFVTKLDSSGSNLIYSTYLGGGSSDYGYGIAVDSQGNAYVTGYTGSNNYPTQNPIQAVYAGLSDVFVTKLDSSGSKIVYSTYLGGGDYDYGNDIAVDAQGNVYVTGHTMSNNYPTQNPIQAVYAGYGDVFVTKLNSSGSSMVYSTYLGGGSDDVGNGIAVDAQGNAYVTGYTGSNNYPTQNPIQAGNAGLSDVIVTKLNSLGSSIVYSTYLGGGSDDGGNGIAVESQGNVYVTGYTWSKNYPTQNPIQVDNAGYWDVIVTKLSAIYTLIVTKTGTGSGTVTSSPAGINCGFDCTGLYAQGTTVTLTATPAAGSTFVVWSGNSDCSDGVVTMSVGKTCIATFNKLNPPSIPTLLRAKATSSSDIMLSWQDNSNNETGFRIQRRLGDCSITNTNVWSLIATRPVNSTSYTNGNLTSAATYSYRILAYNADGRSGFSNCATATTGFAGTPTSPTNLVAASTSANSVKLTWKDNSIDETSLKIYRKDGANAWALLTAINSPNAVSYTDNTASGSTSTTTYSYYLSACNANGCSPSTSVAIVPFKPTNLQAVAGLGRVDLSWMDNSANETTFRVWRRDGNCASANLWNLVGDAGANATAFSDTTVTAGTTYSYSVTAMTQSMIRPYAYGNSRSNCVSVAVQ